MRIRLMTAAAMAPLCVLGLRGVALAQTYTIGGGISTPVQTVNAVNNAPGNVDVNSSGAVNPASGTAVTLNSNNYVTVEGGININNADGAVGILATSTPGGWTGYIANTGTINLGESFTAATNSDGYSEEPFAQGSNRYGIETQGLLIGSVEQGGTVTVQGNNSYGVAILGGLGGSSGNLSVGNGSTTVTGDHSVGVYTAGAISGYVQISGAVTVLGQGSNAVQITGDVNGIGNPSASVPGGISIYSTLSSTAYSTTTRPTTSSLLTQVEQTPSQVEQGGSALIIGGNVPGGIFLGAPPTGTTSLTTADLDGDGIADGAEGTSLVETFGSAPAMVIGGNTTPITIGSFGSCNAYNYGPGDNCFSLIVEGTITGYGVYDGVSAMGLDIGAGGAGVTLTNGLRVAPTGSILATSYQANATALQIEAGATISGLLGLQNEGLIESQVTSSSANSSVAVLLLPGANMTTLTNYGVIHAGMTGDSGSAYGVVDQSGSITTVNNYGQITTQNSPTNAGDTTTGSTVALDLRANTTGVTFTQGVSLNTDVLPSIAGDVLLSSTATNIVNLEAGDIEGTLNMGSGANSALNISGNSTFLGDLLYSNTSTGSTGLTISVTDSSALRDNSPTIVYGKSLAVDGTSTLSFALDPRGAAGTGATNTQFNVGTANIASGATLGVTFVSVPASSDTFTVVQTSAGGLTVGQTNLTASAPFLFNASSQANTSAGTISITVTPKTASQLGLNQAEAAALPAIYASLGQDSGILNALANAPDSATFHANYQQMLPDSAGDVFEVVSSMSKAVARASLGAAGFDNSGPSAPHVTTDQSDDEEDDVGAPGGLWASEYIIGLNQNRQDNEAYRADGLGLVGGIDFGGYGADVSFASANVVKPHDPGDSIVSINRLEGGLYAAPQFGFIHTEARIAGAYLSISERREFAATVPAGDQSSATTVSRTANASWNGYDIDGLLGVSAPFDVTPRLFVSPEAHLDFLDVSEAGYTETGGGSGFDLMVNARSSSQTSLTAGIVTGMRFGSSFVFKPQIELGWDDIVQGGAPNTTARFVYGGPSFTLVPNSMSGGAGVVRLKLDGDGAFVHFSVEAGGEFRSDYQNADLKAVFRISY